LDRVLKSLGVAERDLVAEWAARKPRAIKRVKRILESAGLTIDAVMAETLYESLEEVKSIDAMIAMAEARRNAALCEIERHRAALACALRRTLSQVEDARYSALEIQAGDKPRATS
jgi:ribosomal protein L12E/L44/L45/RPP1/RPP2